MEKKAYVPNKVFITEIDKRLNELEFYFRAKWFQLDGKRVAIQKYLRKSCHDPINAHLAVYDYSMGMKTPLLTLKYTTCCYFDPANPADAEPRDRACIRIPRGRGQYEKTWGGTDYIIGEIYIPDQKASVIYYFNTKKLFEFLKAKEASVTQEWRDYLAAHGTNIDDFYLSLDEGIDISFLEKFGIVEHKDKLYPGSHVFHEIGAQRNWPDREDCYCVDRWPGKDNRKAFWAKWTLRQAADQSKAVAISLADGTGKELEFRSIKEAAQTLWSGESEIVQHKKEDVIRAVLHGRSKTFKAADGVKLTARFL